MNSFWLGFYHLCEWMLILSGIAFFAAIVYIISTLLALKNSALRNAKRLYVPPMNTGKALAITAKGVVLQEKVRVLSLAAKFKDMAGDVTGAATQIREAAKTIHPEDLKDAAANAQSTLRFASTLMQLFRSSPKQNA